MVINCSRLSLLFYFLCFCFCGLFKIRTFTIDHSRSFMHAWYLIHNLVTVVCTLSCSIALRPISRIEVTEGSHSSMDPFRNMQGCWLPGSNLSRWFLILFCFCYISQAESLTDPSEVKSLRAVKRSLTDPSGYLKSWESGDPCTSQWTGVLCYNHTEVKSADGYSHVCELRLLNMNLSGSLAPEVGQLSQLQILDFMWNKISGSIPKEIGNISSLELLLLNGNRLSGVLPDELGNLLKLKRLQVDENNISGSIPKSFANLSSMEHFHFNNNSISGELPVGLAALHKLVHLLVDNNNLTGELPYAYSNLTQLRILQLDNNQFLHGEIPESYANFPKLIKLSLRNCSLVGTIPDLSRISYLRFVDLSWNRLTGSIPSNKLSANMTIINFSHNLLTGPIPESFADLPSLQVLALENNTLNGSIPASIWNDRNFSSGGKLTIDVRNNWLTNVSGELIPSVNVTLRFFGNPLCADNILNVHQFCDSDVGGGNGKCDCVKNSSVTCSKQSCPTDANFEYVPEASVSCFCAAPIRIGYRLKSPSFGYFVPYVGDFEMYVTSSLGLDTYDLSIDSYAWEEGPRLRMYLKIFPTLSDGNRFNDSEVKRITGRFTSWRFGGNDLFGPYELLNVTLLNPYETVIGEAQEKGINMVVLAVIVVATIGGSVTLFVIATLLIFRFRNSLLMSNSNLSSKMSIKIDGVREFTFKDLAIATDNFKSSSQVGRGGYGTVFKGILSDKVVVAVKRAAAGSLQGINEFLTEIKLLSRLHHRNLVSLVGYCGEAGEQMLVYEFMANGTLRDWISEKNEERLCFGTRLRIALGSAKGILYLHTEANPPIFHRDIKSTNILLDSNLTAKVADFGLSRLAPVLDDEGAVPHHVSTVVKGTPGYLDPEYFLTHMLTDKSDVYSLGVVLLELLTGMEPISEGRNIVREVNVAYRSGALFSILDKRMGPYPADCAERFVALALGCCHLNPVKRPSMLDVVRELESLLHMVSDSTTASANSSTVSGISLQPASSTDVTTTFTQESTSLVSTSDFTSDFT